MPTQSRWWGVFAEVVVHILHGLHPQASDDEEELGPNVSQVTGPEESAARPAQKFTFQLLSSIIAKWNTKMAQYPAPGRLRNS